mmetsp:Transcript_33649/g.94534  ORF Transcript_33649/g.94534 Transcript_33649/m.94534 type:complete len:239 (+) Transcript_33649:110-826(+)
MSCHAVPTAAIGALLLAVLAGALLLASRERVCGAMSAARPDRDSRGPMLSVPCTIDVSSFTLFLLVDVLALVAIALSRMEYSYDDKRRSKKLQDRCGYAFAQPGSLTALWGVVGVTGIVQLFLIPFYVGVGALTAILSIICAGGASAIRHSTNFFSDFGAMPGMQHGAFSIHAELASVSPSDYCAMYWDEDLARHGWAYVCAAILAVGSQMVMVASLNAEWERALEELHYMKCFKAES